jgi:hypothetical protein
VVDTTATLGLRGGGADGLRSVRVAATTVLLATKERRADERRRAVGGRGARVDITLGGEYRPLHAMRRFAYFRRPA